MAQSLTEMAKDLTLALVENDMLAPEDMQQQLTKTHASLLELKAHEDRQLGLGTAQESDAGHAPQAINWKKSIRKHTVQCLICGQTFKQLSARHLNQHNLDPRTYRLQFGIPRTQPLSAKATTATRRRVVQDIRPWEKAPTYLQAHETPSASTLSKRTRKPTGATAA